MKDHYTYRVTWSLEDEEFVGLCAGVSAVELAFCQPGRGFLRYLRIGVRLRCGYAIQQRANTGATSGSRLQREVHDPRPPRNASRPCSTSR